MKGKAKNHKQKEIIERLRQLADALPPTSDRKDPKGSFASENEVEEIL